MPRFKVTETDNGGPGVDQELEREIRRVREKNKESQGEYSRDFFREASPPLENLILLSKIDEFMLKREQYLQQQ